MRYPIDPFISAVELAAAIRRKEVSAPRRRTPLSRAEIYVFLPALALAIVILGVFVGNALATDYTIGKVQDKIQTEFQDEFQDDPSFNDW